MGNEEDVVMVTDKNTVVLTAPKLAVDLTKYTQKVQCRLDNNGMIKIISKHGNCCLKKVVTNGLRQSKHSCIHGNHAYEDHPRECHTILSHS